MISKIREWLWAFRNAARLLADNVRLGKLVGEKYEDSELYLTGVEVLDGSALLGFKGAPVEMFAQSFVDMFDGGNAINYVECSLNEPAGKRREFTVTMQLKSGKTAHQLRQEAEDELSALRLQFADEVAKNAKLQEQFDSALLLVRQNQETASTSITQRDEAVALAAGLYSIFDSVTQGQERERRDEWLPKASAFFRGRPAP